MKTLYKSVILIHKSKAINYLNKLTLIKNAVCNNILMFEDCLEALNFLNKENNVNFEPEIIFMSLNTPHMKGWDFIELFNKSKRTEKTNIIILTENDLSIEEKSKLNDYSFIKAVFSQNLETSDIKKIYKNSILR